MANRKKKKIKKQQIVKLMIVMLIILILAIIGILSIIPHKNTNQNTAVSNETVSLPRRTEEELEEVELQELKNMTEKKRMQTYLAKYISYIEQKDYDKAYSLLYDEFKENYFESEEEYENYILKTYPDVIIVDYEDIQRQGKYFIISTTISGIYEEKSIEDEEYNDEEYENEEYDYEDYEEAGEYQYNFSFKQKFVLYENDYNDYVLSFSII